MSETLVCIHGMWSKPSVWEGFKQQMQDQGHTVHCPALPFHDSLETQQGIAIGEISLQNYIDFVVTFVQALDTPVTLVGHSMGGMIVQSVAQQLSLKNLILLNPAAPAGVFAFRPSVLRLFFFHLTKWGFWRKPIQLSWKEARWGVFNHVPEEDARRHYADQLPESGRAAAEIAFWFLDRQRTTAVDFDQVQCPVLVIGAEHDRIVPASVCRSVARRYANARYQEIKGSGHWTLEGAPLQQIIPLSVNAMSEACQK